METILNVKNIEEPKDAVDLKKAQLNKIYTDRFLMLTRLYKIQMTLKKAKIVHKK